MSNSIFIVEDDPVTAKILEKIVVENGYTVAGIEDTGEEAVKKVLANKPDMILMDILLKGQMNGIEASKEIMREYNDLPVIFITVVEKSELTEQIKKSVLKGYLNKPFKEEDVLKVIKDVLSD